MSSSRTPRTPKPQQTIEPSIKIQRQKQKATLMCLQNSFYGIQKRIKSQVITKFIIKSAQQDKKNNKTKFIVFFSSTFFKRKTQAAFDKLLRWKMRNRIMERAVTNLAQRYRKMQKDNLRRSLEKMRVNLSQSKTQVPLRKSGIKKLPLAMISPRLSQESEKSNLLSVSEDSLSDRQIIYEDRKQYGNVDPAAQKIQNQQIKKMQLSNQAKEGLMKMQRYNRFNFNTQIQKVLKEPILNQVKRLQKIKNQNKIMRTKTYDNQLTIICLYNHIRMISEMNRQLTESNTFRDKCAELQRKMGQINGLHKKEVTQFKRRLMRAGVKDVNIQEVIQEQQGQKSSEPMFNHQEIMTLSVLSSALKAKKYKDIKRQAQQFIKKSQRTQLNSVLKDLLIFAQQVQTVDEKGKQKQKQKADLINSITLVDNYLRTDKTNELVSLKNKNKSQTHLNQLCALIETVIEMSTQLKNLKKKQSSSADKSYKLAEKDKLKRSFQMENQELKKQLKNLESKYMDQQKMRQSLKKQKSRPSLLPKKSLQKQPPPEIKIQQSDMGKKIKELEANFQKKIEAISKETSVQLQKAKDAQLKLQKKSKEMEIDLKKKQSQANEFKASAKEISDFSKYYELIKIKISSRQMFTKQVNDFKRSHNQSILLEVFQRFAQEETNRNILLNQLKNINNSFLDNSWKRKQNILQMKTEGEVSDAINQIVQLLLNLAKEKDSQAGTQKQLQTFKSKESKLREQNVNLKEELKKSRQSSIVKKEELQQSQYSISAKSQKPQTPFKSQTPQRIQRSSADKQLSELKSQNDKLRKDLSEKSKTSTPVKSILNTDIDQQTKLKIKEINEASQCYQNIKNKRGQGQNYKMLVNSFGKKYPDGLFSQLFELIQHQDTAHLTLTNQLKSTLASFNDGSWKRKQNKLLLQNYNQIYSNLNSLIQLLLARNNKIQEYVIQKKKEETKQAHLVKYLSNVLTSLSDGSWKRKQQNLQTKQQTQIDKLINQLSSNLFTLERQKEQNTKLIKEFQVKVNNNSNAKQELDELKKEVARLKTESKTRSESTDIKQKLSTQKQKFINQTQQFNQLKLTHQNLNIQNNSLKAQLQNAIKTNYLSNEEIEKKHKQIDNLRRQNGKLKQTTQNQNSKDYEIRKLHNRVQELEILLDQSKQKVQNYTILLNNCKIKRDNLFKLIEQKQQEYEISKQNEQQFLRQKNQKQQKIQELKFRYEETQQSIKKIQIQVDRLICEKQNSQQQKQSLETESSTKDRVITQLRNNLEQKDIVIRNMEGQLELTTNRINNDAAVRDTQVEYFKKQIAMLEDDNHQLKNKLEYQQNDFREKYENVSRQLNEERKFRGERSIVKEQSSSSQIHVTRSGAMMFSQDHEKAELRRQIQMINKELATYVRNAQSQKRQMRQYLQKISNDTQLQTVVFNEQKKILRQNIQRARNEQYEINHQKNKKLREDIQSLREQNQRLRSIIDTNEAAFDQLIHQHQEMTQKINVLSQGNSVSGQENSQLVVEFNQVSREKQELVQHLHFLEKRIEELEGSIDAVVREKQDSMLVGSQAKSEDINALFASLVEQKRQIESKYLEQNHNIVQLHKNYYRVQAELNSFKMLNRSGASHISHREGAGDYSKYLQDKVSNNEQEIKRLLHNEKNLIGKIQTLMANISTIEKQKIELQSMKRQKQFEINFHKNNIERDAAIYNTKISKLEERWAKRQQPIIMEQSQMHPSPLIQHQLQITISRLEEKNRKLTQEIGKLKNSIEELNQEKQQLQIKKDSNYQMGIDFKIITNKYSDLQSDFKKLQHKLHSSQNQLHRLRTSKTADVKAGHHQYQFFGHKMVSQKKDQQILWLKSQHSAKDAQIQKLRSSELQLLNKFKRNNQKQTIFQQLQLKYQREISSHQQTRKQISQLEEFYDRQLQKQKIKQKQSSQQLIRIEEEFHQLNKNYQKMMFQNKKLNEQTEHRRMQSQTLRQIVYQLDQNYTIDGSDDDLQIRILHKISTEISYLTETNRQLKVKCSSIQNSLFSSSTQISDQSYVCSIHSMTQNLLLFLKEEELINSEQVNNNLRQLQVDSNNSTEIYLSNLSIFLKTLILTLFKQQPQAPHTNLKAVRKAFEAYMHQNSEQNFIRLRDMLYE